jgi:ankyrin repeat protein
MDVFPNRYPVVAIQILDYLGDFDFLQCVAVNPSWHQLYQNSTRFQNRIQRLFQSFVVTQYGRRRVPLHRAAELGQTHLCQKILHVSQNQNPRDLDGFTPLHLAAENGHFLTYQLLIQNIRLMINQNYVFQAINTVSSNGTTLLHLAAKNGHAALCQFIILNTWCKDPENIDGDTPFLLAAKNQHQYTCQLFIFNMNSQNPKKNVDGGNLMHTCAARGYFLAFKLLLDEFEDQNPLTNNGLTSLHAAAEKGHVSICKLIINTLKFDIANTRDFYGKTPLHYAAQNGFLDICKLLFQHVNNILPKSVMCETPFSLASSNGHVAVRQLYIEHWTNINLSAHHR